jgi:hypothetical protein
MNANADAEYQEISFAAWALRRHQLLVLQRHRLAGVNA